MESEILGFGIRNTFQGIQNPLTIGIQNPIPGIRIPGCGIQETNEELHFKKYVNIAYEIDHRVCTPFRFMLDACGYLSSLCFIKGSFSGTVLCFIKCDWPQRVRG